MSKTLQIITFCFMALVSMTFIVYGFIKANEAEKNLASAMTAQAVAEEQAENAAKQFQSQAEVVANLQAELAECKSE